MTTPPPTDLDTLTDTVGSRIEITAGGKKYTARVEAFDLPFAEKDLPAWTRENQMELRDIQAAE